MEAKYLTAAGVLAGLALVAVVIAINTNGSSTPSCGLSAAAAGAVVTGATKGKAAAELVGPAAAGVIVPAACKPVVDALVSDPEQEVELEVQLPDGGQTTQTLTGAQLPSAPPAPVQPSCANWITPALEDLCLQGRLPPADPP